MKWKRMGRALVCLLLVCCLLFSVTVTRVQATGTGTGTFVGVAIDKVGFYAQAGALGAGATVFFYVALGLGVVLTAADTVKTLNEYMEYSGEMDVSIYYYPDGSWSYGVDMGFIERVRTFFFEKGVLVQTDDVVLDSRVEIPAEALAEARAARYAALAYYTSSGNGPYFNLGYSNESPVYIEPTSSAGTGMKLYLADNTATGYIWNSFGGFTQFTGVGSQANASKVIISSYKFGTAFSHVDITIDDAELAEVAPQTVPIVDGYPQWAINKQNAILEDETEVEVLPIPFNPVTDIGTLPNGVTQQQVWQGSIADPMPDSDSDAITGTFADTAVGAFITSLIDALWTPIEWIGAQIAAVPAAITDFFTFTTDLSAYAVELTSFFPFCIPWDIYNFFELFQAEPEAPYFVFDVPFPYMEDDWHIEIDLSIWDKQAALVRTLELIGFIVGLAVFTREKFLRG